MVEGLEHPPTPSGPRAEEQRRGQPDRAVDCPDVFVPDVGRREPEDVLLDQVFFPLSSPAFAAFQALLDHPPPPAEPLRHLLLMKAPWE